MMGDRYRVGPGLAVGAEQREDLQKVVRIDNTVLIDRPSSAVFHTEIGAVCPRHRHLICEIAMAAMMISQPSEHSLDRLMPRAESQTTSPLRDVFGVASTRTPPPMMG